MNRRAVTIGAGFSVAALAAVGGVIGFRHWAGRPPTVRADEPSAAVAPAPQPAVPTQRTAAPGKVVLAPITRVPSAPKSPAQPPAAARRTAPVATPAAPSPKASAPQSISVAARPSGARKAPLGRTDLATAAVCHELGSLRSTISLWKLQRDGREPDFVTFPQWEQFVTPDEKGSRALSRPPANEFNGFIRVAVKAGVKPGAAVAGEQIGWVYDTAGKKLWATDAAGSVFDDGAVDLLALDLRRAKNASPAAATRSLAVVLQSMRGMVMLYKLQHNDNPPDFARYPAWEQLVRPTDVDGTLVEAKVPSNVRRDGVYGPYAGATPVNAVNGRYKVAVVADDVQPKREVPGDFGFVFSTKSHRLYALDANGRVTDEMLPGASWTDTRSERAAGQRESVLQTLRSQMAMFKLQHNDRGVDLARYPKWEQLTGRTRLDGTPDPAGKYGPYLAKPPTNWRTGSSAVEVAGKVPGGYRAAKPVGFVVESAGGNVWMVDEQGAVIFD